MIPRKNRLSRTDFPSFKEEKKVWRGLRIQIIAYKGTATQKQNKFSVVVGKRFGVAAKRNMFKRTTYEGTRKYLNAATTEKTKRFIVTPLHGIKDINKTETQKDLEKYFREYHENQR